MSHELTFNIYTPVPEFDGAARVTCVTLHKRRLPSTKEVLPVRYMVAHVILHFNVSQSPETIFLTFETWFVLEGLSHWARDRDFGLWLGNCL